MTKEKYIEIITQTAATLMAQKEVTKFNKDLIAKDSVEAATHIFHEAVEMADIEFEVSEGVTYAEKEF